MTSKLKVEEWSLQEEDGNEIGFIHETKDVAIRDAQELANRRGKPVFLLPTSKRIRVDPESKGD